MHTSLHLQTHLFAKLILVYIREILYRMFVLKLLISLHACVYNCGLETCISKFQETKDSEFFRSIQQLKPIGFQQCAKSCKRHKLCDRISYDWNNLRCQLMTKSAVPVTENKRYQVYTIQDVQTSGTYCTNNPCDETDVCIGTNNGHVCVTDYTYPSCPSKDYVLFQMTCYIFHSSTVSWFTAQSICTALNTSLVRVDNAEVNTFLDNQLTMKGIDVAWLGANDLEEENRFVWANSGADIKYENLYPIWHNNHFDHDCVFMFGGGWWYVTACNDSFAFVCQAYV